MEVFKLDDRKVVGLQRLLETFFILKLNTLALYLYSHSARFVKSVRCFAVSQEFSVAYVKYVKVWKLLKSAL